jgi:hypothetical protein
MECLARDDLRQASRWAAAAAWIEGLIKGAAAQEKRSFKASDPHTTANIQAGIFTDQDA